MENALQLFSYNEYPVRVIMHGEPPTAWFVAKDVCDVLEYTNARKALADHLDDDEKDVTICYTPGGNQSMNIINESGLYCLILRSNMPKAKEFRKWVTAIVLPKVMQNGMSTSVENSPFTSDLLTATKIILDAAGIKDNQLALALDKVATHYTGQSLLALSGVTLIAPTKNQLLTPTEIGRQFKISAIAVNKILASAGWQHNIGSKWEPLEPSMEYAVMLDTGRAHSDGTPIRQLKWDSSILNVFSELMKGGKEND